MNNALGALISVAVLAACGSTSAENNASNAAVLCWIALKPQPAGLVEITGRVFARDNFEGRYTLQIEKSGQSGTSQTAQGGAVTLLAGEEKGLSVTTVNVGAKDHLKVGLTITGADKKVACSSVQMDG